MDYILPEAEVSLSSLASHLEQAGWDPDLEERRIVLHSDGGLSFVIWLDEERKYINFARFQPIPENTQKDYQLVNHLNFEIFLPNFAIDDDSDLQAMYHMIYSGGLMLGQFSRIVKRFSSTMDYVKTQYGAKAGF